MCGEAEAFIANSLLVGADACSPKRSDPHSIILRCARGADLIVNPQKSVEQPYDLVPPAIRYGARCAYKVIECGWHFRLWLKCLCIAQCPKGARRLLVPSSSEFEPADFRYASSYALL
jgi:hypothetical protein